MVPLQNKKPVLKPHALTFRSFYLTKKAFDDFYSNVGLVHSVNCFNGEGGLSVDRSLAICNKPVITWPLGRLANLSPSGASRPRVIN